MRINAICFVCLITVASCTQDKVDSIETETVIDNVVSDETTFDVVLLYSDSAQMQVRIKSPILVRKTINSELIEEFPKGLHVEFLNPNGNVTSYLDAKFATRYERKGIVIAEDSVVVYNRDNDKLETSQLTWDEKKQNLQTNRFVRITKPAKGDTIYGFGLTSDQEFSRFQLNEVSGRSKFDNLVNSIN